MNRCGNRSLSLPRLHHCYLKRLHFLDGLRINFAFMSTVVASRGPGLVESTCIAEQIEQHDTHHFTFLGLEIQTSFFHSNSKSPISTQISNGRRALAEYPEVARVESQAVCRCTVCRHDFLQTSFEFADLFPHWAWFSLALEIKYGTPKYLEKIRDGVSIFTER